MEIFKLVGSIVVDDSQAKQSIGNIKGEASGLSGVFQKAGGAVGSFIGSVSKIAGAVGVFKLVDGAINMITNSFDGAISRVDTLNQFPKVLEMMGVSGEEAEASIDRLSEGIQGLPTALDDVAGSTQRMFTILGDIDLATESTLALNNAFLASGASQADASRGTEQYMQMLSAGKVDMQSWRTLQETMPYALNETAEAFGFTGESAQNDFYDALLAGEITMEEFNAKMIELSEGTGGFAEMALEGSRGIATSWQNIQTAVVTGVGNIIQAFDDWLEANGFGGIPEVLDRIKEAVQGAFSTIVEWVPIALDWILQFKEGLTNGFDGEGFNLDGIVDKLTEFLPTIIEKGQELVGSLIDGILDNLPMITDVAVSLITGFIEGIGTKYEMLLPAGIEILIAIINGIVEAMPQILEAGVQVIETLLTTVLDLLPMIVQSGVELLMALIDGLVSYLPQLISVAIHLIGVLIDGLLSNLPEIITAGIQLIEALVEGIMDLMPQLIPLAVELVNTVVQGLMSHLPAIIQSGIELLLALINGVTGMLPELVTMAVELIMAIVGALIENLPQIITAGLEIIVALISGLIQAIPELVGAIPEIVTAIKTAFADVEWWTIGKDIISGIAKGIGDFAGNLVDKGKEVAGNALNGVKSFLGIKSPSRLFRDEVGKWIPAGIAVGIEDNSDLPLDALNKVIGVEGYDMSGTVRHMNGNRDGENRRFGGDVKQNITIHSPRPLDPIESARQIKKASRQLALEH